VVHTLISEAEKKGISLSFSSSNTDQYIVFADDARISQILLNLVGNAVKFTTEGGVTVKLSGEPDNNFSWTISDTGPGIPGAERERLFERFTQVDTTRTRQSPGTGLGLAIVRELVELQKGTIKVESEAGCGSCFKVLLPLEPVPTRRNLRTLNEKPDNTLNDMSLEHLNLNTLVAEDNEVNRLLIKKILLRLGIDAVFAENGAEAIEAVRTAAEPFDLIFMDVQMPVMDGVTATKLLRGEEACTVPIIAVTANTMENDILQYQKAGMNDHLAKPISLKKFHAMVLKYIKARKGL